MVANLELTHCHCWPILCHHVLVADIVPSVSYCPSRCRISKTKQDRPIVTVECYIEAGTR